MCGTVSQEPSGEVLAEVGRTEAEERLRSKGSDQGESEGEWITLAPEFSATLSEFTRCVKELRGPLYLFGDFSEEECGAQPAIKDWSTASTLRATEWLGTTAGWSPTVSPWTLAQKMEVRVMRNKQCLRRKRKRIQKQVLRTDCIPLNMKQKVLHFLR